MASFVDNENRGGANVSSERESRGRKGKAGSERGKQVAERGMQVA